MQVCEEMVITIFFFGRVMMTIWKLFRQAPCHTLGTFTWTFFASTSWKEYQLPQLLEKHNGREVRLKFCWVSSGEFINYILLMEYFEISDTFRISSLLRKILNLMWDSINFQFSSFEAGTMTRWARSPGNADVQDSSGGCTLRPCSTQYLFYP